LRQPSRGERQKRNRSFSQTVIQGRMINVSSAEPLKRVQDGADMRALIFSFLVALTPVPTQAFERITDVEEFSRLIEGRALTRFGIRLEVTAQSATAGQITGRGFGYPVTGAWRWDAGFFCRDLDWGGSDLGFNCQAVLRDGETVRFVSDQGSGDSADFRLR